MRCFYRQMEALYRFWIYRESKAYEAIRLSMGNISRLLWEDGRRRGRRKRREKKFRPTGGNYWQRNWEHTKWEKLNDRPKGQGDRKTHDLPWTVTNNNFFFAWVQSLAYTVGTYSTYFSRLLQPFGRSYPTTSTRYSTELPLAPTDLTGS